MAKEPVDYPERVCKGCLQLLGKEVAFKPARKTQHFHDADCRKRYYAWLYKHQAHKCPLCGEVHIPAAARASRQTKITSVEMLERATTR